MRRWSAILKTPSWSKLLVPAFLGQCLGAAHLGRFDLVDGLFGLALTLALAIYIVLLNDFADREVDGLKRRLFPHAGSPKTIPDRILSAPIVGALGLVAALTCLTLGYLGEDFLGRPALFEAVLIAMALFWAYSLRPLRLNYRGGGELLEAIGVGLWLPWLNAYLQAGMGVESVCWLPRGFALCGGFVCLALCSAIASGLSDEVSDRRGGKRTIVVTLGNRSARQLILGLYYLAPIVWIVTGIVAPGVPLVGALVGALVVIYFAKEVRVALAHATTNAFSAQAEFKTRLHRAISESAQWAALTTLLWQLFVR